MSTMKTITVDLGERTYPITIGAGILTDVAERLRATGDGTRVAVVTNPIVAEHYREGLVRALRGAGIEPTVIEIPAGEEHKNLAWLAFLYDRFIEARIDRHSTILALGGGVIGDLAGFAAATFLRGVPYVQIPTTLLAQVDSSVGGKTAVNHPNGKNLIGAFHQPRLVWIDVHTLRTLPRREIGAGLAEVIKYAMILSPALFAQLEKDIEALVALNDDVLIDIVGQCCALKAAVVGQDERESDYRAILNFGHTIGHAVEMLTDYRRFLHGEAVAIGMVCAARLSHARGHSRHDLVPRLTQLLQRAGLPTAMPADLTGKQIALAVETDKKAAGGTIKFVCVEEIGRTRFDLLTAEEISRYARA